jgi:hypothetical protein
MYSPRLSWGLLLQYFFYKRIDFLAADLKNDIKKEIFSKPLFG